MSRPAPALLPAAPAHPATSSAGESLTTARRPDLHLYAPTPRRRPAAAPGRRTRRSLETNADGRVDVHPAEISPPVEAPSPEPDYHDVVRSLALIRSRRGPACEAPDRVTAGAIALPGRGGDHDTPPDVTQRAAGGPTQPAVSGRAGDPSVPAVPGRATTDRTAAEAAAAASDGPDVLDGWARRFATAVLEAIDGRRPTTHLVRWTDEASYATVRAAANRHHERYTASRKAAGRVARATPPATPRLRLGGVGVCPIGTMAAEVSAVVLGPNRAHALAFRLDRRHGRWMASGLILVR